MTLWDFLDKHSVLAWAAVILFGLALPRIKIKWRWTRDKTAISEQLPKEKQ